MHASQGVRARALAGLRLLGIATRRPLVGPRLVGLEITHFCNLSCGFCESHGRHIAFPIIRRQPYEGGRRSMDLDTVERLCRSLARLGVGWVELSGKGDPIVHPKLPEIVRIVTGAGLRCSMFTNGSAPRSDLASTLVDSGLDRLNLSLNAASREVWARVAGKDLWDRTLSFLKEVLELRNRSGTARPWVRVSFVVCRENVEDMARSVELCCDLGVDEGGWCVMGELPEIAHLQLDRDEVTGLLTSVPEWARRLEARGVAHDLRGFSEDLRVRLGGRGPQDNPLQRALPCYEGWMHAVIGPDGIVTPCCYCEDERLGNVVEQDFAEVWRGQRYEDLRRRSLAMPRTQESICWECYATCNRAQENRAVHRRLHPFRKIEPVAGATGDVRTPRSRERE